MIKLLSLPVDVSACGQYRIRQPIEGLNKYTDVNGYVINTATDDFTKLPAVMEAADVIMYRPGSEAGIVKILESGVKVKGKWVADIDDNIELISPYSQFYKEYGQQEVMHEGKLLWEDGRDGFSLMANKERLVYLQWGLKRADLILVTTEKLAEYARKFNKNVYVNPNSIDMSHWWKLNNKVNEPLKVIWQGSPSHYDDWYAIKEPLNKLMRQFKFTLYMLGSQYKGIFDDDNWSRVIPLPWVAFEAHSYRMMALQPDLALIPLSDDPFNAYKSSIKFYEMSAMGIPSVVSNVEPYSHDIQEGKNALGYTTPEEFYDQLKKLIENKGLRANIGNAAYQWVKKEHSLEEASKKLALRIEELVKS